MSEQMIFFILNMLKISYIPKPVSKTRFSVHRSTLGLDMNISIDYNLATICKVNRFFSFPSFYPSHNKIKRSI